MTETEPPKKRLRAGVRWALLLVALLAAAVFGYGRYVLPARTDSQQVYDNLAVSNTLMEKLDKTAAQHEERIRNLETAVQKLASAPPPAAAAVEAAPSAPPAPSGSAPAPGADDARIAALEKEIAALKAAAPMQSGENVGKSIHLLSAFHRLSDKILSGKPFAAELSAFEDAENPADQSSGSPLATFAPYADSGIPTFATLLASFDQAVDTLNTANAVPPANAGFAERLRYNLTHLVSIRRIDEAQTGSSEQAVIGRAQAHLEREEIEAAMAEIKSLSENARGNFAAWLDDAQMVTEAPSLIDQLEETVMQKAFHTEAKAPEPAAEPGQAKPPEPAPASPLPKT